MNENEVFLDPLGDTARSLFGLSYLFPYQRLVITNILEAAQAKGIPLNLPIAQGDLQSAAADDEQLQNMADNDQTDRETLGRQIVILPTGAGKSLCFQLPATLIDGITLVIYPILSLMADQQRRLQEKGFSPVIIRGGQSNEEREEIWQKLESGQSKFIITNPEILLKPQVKEPLSRFKIVHLVIDEAHCVSEWGESFRPCYLEVGSIIKALNPPLVTAFTATASSPVLEKIKKYIFGDLEASMTMGNPDRSNINYSAKGCVNRNLAVRDLLIKHERPAIVFCSSRMGTERLARYLRNETVEMGFSWHREIRFYHAGLSRKEKAETEKWLLCNSEAVLISTCAFGMGIDKADIRTVIHRDCPPSVESYLQETGRAGRDGKQSTAILLWGPEDEAAITRRKEADKQRITLLLNYARNIENCRRHSLLAMLNFDSNSEVPEKNCCDICEGEATEKLREEQSIIDFFRNNKRSYTQNKAAFILSQNKTIRWSQEEASKVISYLINRNKLKRLKHFPWRNKITT